MIPNIVSRLEGLAEWLDTEQPPSVATVRKAVLKMAYELKQTPDPRLHSERWWATFNAALAGCLHRADSYNAVSRARELADETHGKLEDM